MSGKLHLLTHGILTVILWGWSYCYAHFTDKGFEAQRG